MFDLKFGGMYWLFWWVCACAFAVWLRFLILRFVWYFGCGNASILRWVGVVWLLFGFWFSIVCLGFGYCGFGGPGFVVWCMLV